MLETPTILAELWLPILLSAVFVFIASSLIHMVLMLHKSDYRKVQDEDALLRVVGAQNLDQGEYMFPCAGSAADWKDPELIAKFQQGPVGWLTVMPKGMPAMGGTLFQWFVYCIVIGVFVGYIGTLAMPHGADYLSVFQLCGTAAVLGYAFSAVPQSIWKGQRWSTTFRFIVDGLVYGLLTGGTFGWLWPGA